MNIALSLIKPYISLVYNFIGVVSRVFRVYGPDCHHPPKWPRTINVEGQSDLLLRSRFLSRQFTAMFVVGVGR